MQSVGGPAVPPAAEHSTYMLQAGLLAWLLIWQWRAMTGAIWTVEHPLATILIRDLFALGWQITFISTFFINHAALRDAEPVERILSATSASAAFANRICCNFRLIALL